jgi:hypothetical protein
VSDLAEALNGLIKGPLIIDDNFLKQVGNTVEAQRILDDYIVFVWDKIPGNDNILLKKILINILGINWVKTAEIEKIDNCSTIRVFYKEKSLLL